jgi:hypothetical protein
MAEDRKSLRARIRALEYEERGFLSSYATLMDAYQINKAQRYAQMASRARAQADKRRDRINELQRTLQNLSD